MSPFKRYVYLYQNPIISSGKYRSVWGSHCITGCLRGCQHDSPKRLPWPWGRHEHDVTISLGCFDCKWFMQKISQAKWAFEHPPYRPMCQIQDIFQQHFHIIQFVRWDSTSRQSQNAVRLQHSYMSSIIVHAMKFAVLYSAPSLYAIYTNDT